MMRLNLMSRLLRLRSLAPGALLGLLLFATPAHAGQYVVWPVSGSGTLTPSVGSPSTLTSPDFEYSGGSFSWSFTEHWAYSWEPDDEPDDFPVSATYEVSGSVTLLLTCAPSSQEYESGSGSGSATFGGSTVTADAEFPMGGGESGHHNGETQPLSVVRSLSGWDGEFDVTYSGSISGAGAGTTASVSHTRGSGGVSQARLIYFTGPTDGQQLHTGAGYLARIVDLGGKWKPVLTDDQEIARSAQYYARLTGDLDGLSDVGALSLIPNDTKRKWRTWGPKSTILDRGTYTVGVTLIRKIFSPAISVIEEGFAPPITFTVVE